LKLNGLHSGISQKMILFITTAVKTSNPTEKEEDFDNTSLQRIGFLEDTSGLL
jgi:hypothetical protein